MTTKQLIRRARRLWSNPNVPAHINRHNQRQWVRSVLRLKDKWPLWRNVPREVLRESAARLNKQPWSAR